MDVLWCHFKSGSGSSENECEVFNFVLSGVGQGSPQPGVMKELRQMATDLRSVPIFCLKSFRFVLGLVYILTMITDNIQFNSFEFCVFSIFNNEHCCTALQEYKKSK